jgi:hypothetical protein
MKNKLKAAVFLALAFVTMATRVAYAEPDPPPRQMRVIGEVTRVDLESNAFSLRSRGGDDFRFLVDRSTKFRSPDGKVKDLSELGSGMHALVVALEQDDGVLQARLIATDGVEKPSEFIRSTGEIIQVDVPAGTFGLRKADGATLRFQTGERTRFRSRDGSIDGVEDLTPGMVALVIAVRLEDGVLFAALVAAGERGEVPSVREFRGEVADVVPGQGKFSLLGSDGEVRTFETIDRTKFRSRDGAVKDIHDLKKGMKAIVDAVVKEDGALIAIFVGVLSEQDRPRDIVRAAGRIVELGKHEFTIERRDGGRMTFSVDGSTTFKSRDGSVTEFDDLEVGMIALVGARKLGEEKLKAIWVGAGWRALDRPTNPENQPSPDLPGRSSDQDSVL